MRWDPLGPVKPTLLGPALRSVKAVNLNAYIQCAGPDACQAFPYDCPDCRKSRELEIMIINHKYAACLVLLLASTSVYALDPNKELIERGEWPSGAYKLDLKNGKMIDESGKEFKFESVKKKNDEVAKLKESLNFSGLEQYVTSGAFNGMPYEDLRKFEGQDLSRVKEMMYDEQWAPYWVAMARSIGMLGSDSGVDFLIKYIEKNDNPSDAAFDAKLSALDALGTMTARLGNQKAFIFLVKAVEPNTAQRLATPYSSKAARPLLISAALDGLAATGREEAVEILRGKMKRSAGSGFDYLTAETGTRDAESMKNLVEQAEHVRRNGLVPRHDFDSESSGVKVMP